MDSELTSEASVKALNQGVATTDSPSFAGLTTTANISFGDNDKAIFGAGSDLQIYHDGSDSYVDDAGVGDLVLRGNNQVLIRDTGTNEVMGNFRSSGAVTLYYDNAEKISTTSTGIDVTGDVSIGDGSASATRLLMGSGDDSKMFHNGTDTYWINDTGNIIIRNQSDDKDILFQTDNGSGGTTTYITVDGSETDVSLHYGGNQKLATTSTGIDVTGTVTADGLTVDGSAAFNLGSGEEVSIYRSTDYAVLRLGASSTDHWSFQEAGTNSLYLGSTDSGTSVNHVKLDNNGDISFYEDTGTTPKLFWDASAESLGIGTSSPDEQMHLHGGSSATRLRISGGALNETYGGFIEGEGVSGQGGHLRLGVVDNGTDRVAIEIEEQGNQIVFDTAGAERMRILSGGNITIGTVDAYFYSNASSGGTTIDAGFKLESSNQALGFWTADTERMRLDASGNLLVGDTSATFNDTAKTVIRPSSDNWVIKPTVCTSFNRTASDGDILEFYRGSSSKVGSIGSASNYLTIGKNDTGLLFMDASDYIEPFNLSTSAARDAAIDLGRSAARFKDLYLSGTARTGLNIHLQDSGTTRGKIELNASDTDDLDIKAVSLGSNMKFFTVDTERMRIDSGGNAIFTKANGAYLQLKDASAVRGAINVETSDGLVFTTGASFSERMRIDASGNVGICQSSPSSYYAKDLVVGSGSAEEGITIRGSSSGRSYLMFADGTSGNEQDR